MKKYKRFKDIRRSLRNNEPKLAKNKPKCTFQTAYMIHGPAPPLIPSVWEVPLGLKLRGPAQHEA